MQLAGDYACAGRDVVVAKVLEILGSESLHDVHNHHNFAWREEHFGRDYWVIRKGCTPARPGQEGFVGGSMGDESVILVGVESPDNEAALYSTVHGAGRVMSRTEARGRTRKDPETGKKVRLPGRVRHDEMQEWLRAKGVHLIGGDLDEAPQAYRRLPDVLAHHAGTVEIEHTLRPFAVVMAGADVFDPFKD
jgi:tRNA-splicing ligase RtcB